MEENTIQYYPSRVYKQLLWSTELNKQESKNLATVIVYGDIHEV